MKLIATDRSGRNLNVLLWVLQVLLAMLFMFAGVMKFVMPIEEMTKLIALPGWFLHFIGVAEILGAIGLVLPGLLRIRTGLTPLAAAALVVIMVGATAVNLKIRQRGAALTTVVVGLLLVIVAYNVGGWRRTPNRLQARHSSLQTILCKHTAADFSGAFIHGSHVGLTQTTAFGHFGETPNIRDRLRRVSSSRCRTIPRARSCGRQIVVSRAWGGVRCVRN